MRPELDQRCEEWKIQQLNAQQVVMESDTGRLVEGLLVIIKGGLPVYPSKLDAYIPLCLLYCTNFPASHQTIHRFNMIQHILVH